MRQVAMVANGNSVTQHGQRCADLLGKLMLLRGAPAQVPQRIPDETGDCATQQTL